MLRPRDNYSRVEVRAINYYNLRSDPKLSHRPCHVFNRPAGRKIPSRPSENIPPPLPCFCSSWTSRLSRPNCQVSFWTPMSQAARFQSMLVGTAQAPLVFPMEPSFLAPFPSAGTGANFNLVSRPPESVCLITQVEIQGVDSLLGCFLGDRSHLIKTPWRPRRPIFFWIRRTGLRARPRGRPMAYCVKVRPRESADGQTFSTRGPITSTFHCATLTF